MSNQPETMEETAAVSRYVAWVTRGVIPNYVELPSRLNEMIEESSSSLRNFLKYPMTSSKCIEILPETLLESTNSDHSLAELDKALQDLQNLDALPGLADQS